MLKFTILYFILFNVALAQNSFNPEGKKWFYEGSDLPPVLMTFAKGVVKLTDKEGKPALKYLGQIKWTYDEKKQIIKLTMKDAPKDVLKTLDWHAKKKNRDKYDPLEVNMDKKTVTYEFPNAMNFLGFMYYEKK